MSDTPSGSPSIDGSTGPAFVTSDFPDYETIRLEIDEESSIATVTINRPHALNAFTQTTLDEFADLWPRVRYDGRINAVVLRADMESRAFSSGADVRGGDDGAQGLFHNPNVYSERAAVESLGPKMNFVWKPVICAVHGICAGGAMFWVNESDIVICSDDAQFFDPHLTHGLASALGPVGMSHRINLGEVLRYTIMSNDERLGAETALRIGLVSEITTRENLWARADEIAKLAAAKHPVAMQGSIKAIWESREAGRKAALERAMMYSAVARAHDPGKLSSNAAGKSKDTPRRKYTVR